MEVQYVLMLMRLIFLKESQILFLIHLRFFFFCHSKGCCYYCHAGTETASVPLASLGNLWAGVWAGGPMVSQVSSLGVCACTDPTRRTLWLLIKSLSSGLGSV